MMKRILLLLFVLSSTACAAAIDEEQVDAVMALEGDPEAGAEFYSNNCERCHGPDGNGEGQGPSLQGNSLGTEEIVRTVLRGPLSMPSFQDESDQDVADVAAFVEML